MVKDAATYSRGQYMAEEDDEASLRVQARTQIQRSQGPTVILTVFGP